MDKVLVGIVALSLISIQAAGAYTSRWRDRRIVQDMGDWNIAQTAAATDEPWILGQSHVGDDRPVADGSIKLLAILGGVPRGDTWPFRIQFRGSLFSVDSEWLAPYPVLEHDGQVVICRVNDAAIDRPDDRFKPLYVVPFEWQKFVAPAVDYCCHNQQLFSLEHSARNRAPLTKLLSDENPLIAAAACRVLAQKWELDDKVIVDSTVLQSDGLKQALFTYILLKFSTEDEREYIVNNIDRSLDPVNTSEKLKWIALGTSAAFANGQSYDDRSGFTSKLLHSIGGKEATLDKDTDTDRYIAFMVSKEGMFRGIHFNPVPKPNSTPPQSAAK